MTLSTQAMDSALAAEQTRLHRSVVAMSAGASALLGIVLAVVLWSSVDGPRLLGWLAGLALALGARLAVAWAHDRAPTDTPAHRVWLRRYRAAFVVHGLVWGAAGVMLLPTASAAQFNMLAFALFAVTAGSLLATAFDLVAAALFFTPALAPLVVYLFTHGQQTSPGVGVLVLAFVPIALLGALRTQRSLREHVRLRAAQTERDRALLHSTRQAMQAQHELAEKHHLLSQLLQTTQQGFWFIDGEGMTTDVNPAMCRLLGRPREQVVGRSVFTFFDGADLQALREQIEARRRGDAGGYTIGITRPDGTRLDCFNNATPINDTQGRPLGSIGLWTDITKHRQAESALRTYEVVANSITDMVSVIGEDRVYRMVNDEWCRRLGLARNDVIGRRTPEVIPTLLTAQRQQALHECIELQQVRVARGPADAPGLDGRVYESTYYPYTADAEGVRCAVVVSRDVSAQEADRQKLAASAEYLRRTLNATGDAIFATDALDPAEPVRFSNQQMLQMWGIPADKAATLTTDDIASYIDPLVPDADAHSQWVAQIVAAGVPHESHLHLRDGRILLQRYATARVAERHLRVWSFRDVTTAQRALQVVRASEAQQRALLEAFPGYLAALDPDLRYTGVNDRLAALLGKPRDEILGRHVRELLGEQRLRRVQAQMQRARAGLPAVMESEYPASADRPRLVVEVIHVAGPLEPDGRQSWYVFGLDVTARKHAEEALIVARDEAERANRAKSQFLSHMSHELRTPMNAILGFGQLLGSDPQQPLSSRQQDHVHEILRGARHLLDLINEVLDLGRIEAGELQVEGVPIRLDALVEDCLGLMRPLAQSHGVQLQPPALLPPGECVLADRTRLKQVLLNLLANAIKYNRPGGDVALACSRESDALRISVRDHGPGLTAAEQQRLFQPFERLAAGQTNVEGTGIGLALSRRLVEAMGGTVGVDSVVGSGSTFWVELPRADAPALVDGDGAPAAADAVAGAAPRVAGPLRSVLYIEDNPVNVILMEAMLARLPGVRVLSAPLPLEGLALAHSDRPDLILLDIQLPGIDGFEVLRRLRMNEATRAIPVIAVSANAMPSDIDSGLAAGFCAYLTKPIELEQLLATVQRTLQGPAPAATG